MQLSNHGAVAQFIKKTFTSNLGHVGKCDLDCSMVVGARQADCSKLFRKLQISRDLPTHQSPEFKQKAVKSIQ